MMKSPEPPPVRSYTGPTGIRVLENGTALHIDGYPDAARVVQLATPVGKRLAALRLHEVDLTFSERLIQMFGNTLTEPPNDISSALWICALTKFYSCFGTSAARFRLDQNAIYGKTPAALTAFNYFKDIRDKHVVHDENNYNYPITGIVLGHKNEVQDIISMNFTAVIYNREAGQTLYNLITMAQKYVVDQIDATLQQAFDEARAMTPCQRAKLANVQVQIPTPEDASRTR